MKMKKAMAICLAIALCFQRLSMAAGSIFLGIATAIFLVLLYKAYKNGELRDKIEPYKCYYKVFGFMFLCMIPSLIFSADPKDSTKLFCEMFFYRMMPFYIITLFIDDAKWIKNIFIVLIVSLSVDSLVALGQLLLGMTSRGWGFGGNSLHLSSILSVMIPIVLVAIFDDSFDKGIKRICLLALPCLILGVLAGKSRGSWLTLCIVVPIIMAIYSFKNKKAFMAFLVALVCLGAFFGTSDVYKKRFTSIANVSTDNSNIARLSMWKASMNMIKDNPVVGVGLGQFGDAYQTKYYLDKRWKHYNHCHNNVLKIWSETGTIGVVGFLAMYLFILIANFKNWMKDKNPYSLINWCGWLSFIIFGMFDVIIDHGAITKIWWFVLAAMLALYNSEKDSKNNIKQ